MTYFTPVLFSEVEDCIITQAKGKVKRVEKALIRHGALKKDIFSTAYKKHLFEFSFVSPYNKALLTCALHTKRRKLWILST
ncbi:MAG: hypothetical protein ACK4TN_01425 [Brevinematales bacterium]